MIPSKIPRDRVQAQRIGLISDTHVHAGKIDALPASALEAFSGSDLILALGDMGEARALDQLAEVAPVLATRGMDDARDERMKARVRVIEAGGFTIGAVFDLTLRKAIEVDDTLRLGPKPLPDALCGLFGEPVQIVAFAMTHRPMVCYADRTLLVNPGSATLPAEPPGSVAVLDLARGVASVEVVRLG